MPKDSTVMNEVTIALRLPKKLLDQIDSLVDATECESRSQFIRDTVSGVITISEVSPLNEEEPTRIFKLYMRFLEWLSRPFESFLYVMFRRSLATSDRAFQVEYAKLMSVLLVGQRNGENPA